jgi:GAF domain-containing protein
MLNRVKALLASPSFEGDVVKTRNAQLVNAIVWSGVVLLLFMVPAIVMSADSATERLLTLIPSIVFVLISIVVSFFLRRGRIELASVILLSLLFTIFTLSLYAFGGLRNPMSGGYLIVIFLAGLLLGRVGSFAFGGLSVMGAIAIYALEINGGLLNMPAQPIQSGDLVVFLGIIFIMSVIGGFTLRTINNTTERLQDAQRVLQEQNRDLAASRDAFQEQARALERRARSLEAVAGVARDTTSTLDLEPLLTNVVALVSRRLNYYHVGIFLLDEMRENVVLRAAFSAEGQQLVDVGYRVPLDNSTVVGAVAVQEKTRVLQSLGEREIVSDYHAALSEARSEIVLPLAARGKTIGVLDVQSRNPHGFEDEEITVLEILSDQIAVAISNARLFEQVQQSLEAERRAYGELSREAWAELVRRRLTQGFTYKEGQTVPVKDVESSLEGADDLPTLSLPIQVRGNTIGTLVAHKSEAAPNWTAEDKALMESLVEQVASALESARLYEDTQRRAAREQMTSEVTARMRETLDMDTVLRTAADEMRQVLGLDRLVVRVGTPGEADGE